MPGSLKDSCLQPRHTKAVIKAALKSERGAKILWCVVEAEEDQTVYEKFFDSASVRIIPSHDESGKKSSHNVESIVSELHSEEQNPKVVGIRDKDYTTFDSDYVRPNNVFLTDCRDLEMMMFAAKSVVEGLSEWNKDFPAKISESLSKSRYLGYLRIYNEANKLNCRFKDKLDKMELIWDYRSQKVCDDYKAKLFSKFRENICRRLTLEELNDFIKSLELESYPDYDICQGHDVCRLLRAMMKRQPYNIQSNLFQFMVKSYSPEDFGQTNLYRNIMVVLENSMQH